MANTSTVVEHALDLLGLVGPVEARRMFGGHGIFFRGVMFGLVDDDELFLKTDERCRDRFRDAGCRMWTYGHMEETSYWRPPDEAHEDAESMLPWARLSLDAALRAHEAKVAKARAAAARKAEREARPLTRSTKTRTKTETKSKSGRGRRR